MANIGDSSALSVIPEEKGSARKHPASNGDYDYGNSGHKMKSAYGGSKKKTHPLMLGPVRQVQGKIVSLHSASRNNLSEFTQRIMSAKLLRVKQVQNQLNETQMQLNELINENRILRNMQKRHEGALRRYEGNHAELPQLIRSHNEEIRTLKANNKLIKAQLRESNTKLKERENELEALRDSYTKLKKLSTEKNLLEREKLQKKVDDLQEVIKEQEEKIQVLSRKILLESKNYRHHLNVEMLKHKETQKDLNSALTMISKLESQLMSKDRPTGKVLLKRDSKTVVPIVSNKPSDIHTNAPLPEDDFPPREHGKNNYQNPESPESELEILNMMGSSEDTPSPTQDIFPDIIKSRKSTSTLSRANDRNIPKSHASPDSNNSLFPRKPIPTPALKKSILKNSRFSSDVEANAKIITEKLTENMESINDLAHKVETHSSLNDRKTKSSFGFDQTFNDSKTSTKTDSENHSETDTSQRLLEPPLSQQDAIRNVPKRKFQHSPNTQKTPGPDPFEQLTDLENQKLATMTKTWNELKGKIQEERKKAEQEIKQLSHINGVDPSTSPSPSLPSNPEEDFTVPEFPDFSFDPPKKLTFPCDDAFILKELEKTDRIFTRLKNDAKTSSRRSSVTDKNPKSAPTPKPTQQNLKSFKTETHRDPKYLQQFQTEYQKQNLIKALKAIDDERVPSYSSDDSEEDSATYHPSKPLSQGSPPNYFASKTPSALAPSETFKFDYGALGQVNE